MKSNYIAAGMLTICMMAQSFPVLAADSQSVSIDSFTDAGIIQGHWALKDINTALEHKGISGYTDGSFKPNGKITTAELLSMILNTSGKGITGEGVWPVNVMNTAYDLGIITPEEIPASEADTALVREKMAMILVRSAVVLNGEETENIEQVNRNLIFDIDEADPKYQDFIMDAYSLGLLAGTDSGFQPKGSTTRAEACAITNRLMNYVPRVDNINTNTAPSEGLVYDYLPDYSNVGLSGEVYPAEGMIGPDGKVITRDPVTGVLGFGNGQTGGIYLGITPPNRDPEKYAIHVGSTAYDTYDGMDGEYHKRGEFVYWSNEWRKIDDVAYEKLNREHPAGSDTVGLKADIYGNIIEPGSSASPLYECVHVFDVYIWTSCDETTYEVYYEDGKPLIRPLTESPDYMAH